MFNLPLIPFSKDFFVLSNQFKKEICFYTLPHLSDDEINFQ